MNYAVFKIAPISDEPFLRFPQSSAYSDGRRLNYCALGLFNLRLSFYIGLSTYDWPLVQWSLHVLGLLDARILQPNFLRIRLHGTLRDVILWARYDKFRCQWHHQSQASRAQCLRCSPIFLAWFLRSPATTSHSQPKQAYLPAISQTHHGFVISLVRPHQIFVAVGYV